MKIKNQTPVSGIQIENTISMAVQNRNCKRNPLYLILIAFFGALGSVFTFLSMFQPMYHKAAFSFFFAAEFALCTLLTLLPRKYTPLRIGAGVIYLFLLYGYWKPFCNGFIYLVNTVYKVIYMTDWERFSVAAEFTESYSVTVFLVLIFLPILYMLCCAVLHFQNFFLSLIATFPYVEIGFYFGVAANRFFAVMLFAFWCSMAAVHFSNFGTYHGKGQTSFFLRRDNTFFPVSSMRFMVTEKIGILTLAGVMIICMITQQILQITNYQRSDEIKQMRSHVQDYLASVMVGDAGDTSELWQSLWISRKQKNNRVVVDLGQESKREFDNVSISGLTFSDLPEGRIYLKYCTGEVYGDNTWSMLDERLYENDVFALFETLNYYPQEFLYPNVQNDLIPPITMTLQNVKGIVNKCVPYAFQEQEALQCLHDNQFSGFSSTYTISGNQDFESILLNSSQSWVTGSLYEGCRSQNRDVFASLFDYTSLAAISMTVTGQGQVTSSAVSGLSGTSALSEVFSVQSYSNAPETLESILLSRYGYKDFVMEHDTQLPDTEALDNVRAAYSDLLDHFSVYSATPIETVEFLQALREAVCSDMTYTLAPGRTPSDEDFVEYFLLENKQGYCMHYATAGVVLARMAGIPARYCEGYMVDLNENPTLEETELNGEAVYAVDVLDSNAHAWVEFYVDGWGWIPFEFTFTETVQPIIPEPETEAVTETLPATTSAPVTPTTPAATSPSGGITPSPSQVHTVHSYLPQIFALLGSFLLIAAALGTVYLLRKISIKKRNRLFTQKDRNAAALCIYSYLLRLMKRCGVNVQEQRTAILAQEGTEKCGSYLENDTMETAVFIAAKAKYSHHTISDQELQILLKTARKLADGIYQKASAMEKLKLKFILHLV